MFGDDFDRRREKANREMDASFKRIKRLAIAGALLTLAFYASLIFAVGWVVGKLLQHFGVI